MKKGVQIYFEQNQRIAIEFLKLYMYNIGDMLTIIPYLIMKKRMENENIKNELKKITFTIDNAVSSLDYLYYNPENIRNKRNKWILLRNIFFFTIFDIVAQLSSVIYYIVKEDQKLVVKQANLNSTLIFNIILIIISVF